MTKERYIPQDNQWLPDDDFDVLEASEAIYTELGTRFPIEWEDDGEVVIDFAKIPDSVTESDVKQAVRDNHPLR